jgi:hypothetical protein
MRYTTIEPPRLWPDEREWQHLFGEDDLIHPDFPRPRLRCWVWNRDQAGVICFPASDGSFVVLLDDCELARVKQQNLSPLYRGRGRFQWCQRAGAQVFVWSRFDFGEIQDTEPALDKLCVRLARCGKTISVELADAFPVNELEAPPKPKRRGKRCA